MWLKVTIVLSAFCIMLSPAALQPVLCPPQETCIYALLYFPTMLKISLRANALQYCVCLVQAPAARTPTLWTPVVTVLLIREDRD